MTQDPTPGLSKLLAAEPDLVDRIFDYVLQVLPELNSSPDKLEEAKDAVRGEFRGERVTISPASEAARAATARRVLSTFNGRNATEVARELGIGRATVYRILKQAGGR